MEQNIENLQQFFNMDGEKANLIKVSDELLTALEFQ
jgi:hypothetical protein